MVPVVFEQAQALTTLGSRPLAVLTASENLGTEGWAAAQDRMAALSTDSLHTRRRVDPRRTRRGPARLPPSRCAPSPPSSTPSAPGPPSPPPDHPFARHPPPTHLRSTDVPRTRPPTTPHPPPTTSEGPRKSWALLGVALAAQILVVLDISVVNTALPDHRTLPAPGRRRACSGSSRRT